VRLEGLGQLKNPIGNRTRDLPACSIAPQPTTLPHASNSLVTAMNLKGKNMPTFLAAAMFLVYIQQSEPQRKILQNANIQYLIIISESSATTSQLCTIIT
jgi:hypothetical protein